MIYLIDADTLCFAAAVVAEGMNDVQAIWNVNNGLESHLAQYGIKDYQLFVTGKTNFRYQIFPEYKRGRPPSPEHLAACKRHLVDEYAARMSVNCEADDEIGIVSTQLWDAGVEFTIDSMDKDLDQLPGPHLSPEIMRLGVVVKEARRYYVSPQDGLRFFYTQLLTGDPVDGIKGAHNIGKTKAPKIITNCNTEQEYIEAIRPYYSCDEEMEMNGACLWLWRKENDIWKIPSSSSAVTSLDDTVREQPSMPTKNMELPTE